MSDRPDVHGLWIGNKLSPMELLTIESFVAHGYRFRLWVYESIENIPTSVVISDANEIISFKEVFSYEHANKFGHGKGSYAGFSDIFRYKLLYELGGIWVDMDMTCLQPMRHDTPYIFRFHKHAGVVGNYMQCPQGSELMLWCYQQALAQVKADNTDWMLPIRILNSGIEKFGLKHFIQDFSNEDSFPLILKLLKSKKHLDSNWKVLHWMNEEFRRVGIDKSKAIVGSALEHLYNQYQIPHEKDTSQEGKLWKMSKIHYVYINLISRWKWYKQKIAG